jgi:leader peptidase (prepilin peptidase) / N-methyltransferase
MTAFVAVVSGVIGLMVGSFLNVVIHRVPAGQSVVKPRSRCPGCGTQLAERDNVPVVSWLLLRGRCRTCGMRISVRYPLVELLTGVMFVVVGAKFGADWALPAFLLFTASLIALSAIDLEHFRIPNRILIVTLWAGFPLLLLAAALDDRWDDLRDGLVGGVAALALLLVIHLISPRGMGMGDVKLAGVLGLFLGFLSIGRVFVGLFLGFVLGAVIGVLLIATRIKSRKDRIPFGPFLAAGALLSVLVGGPIVDWYRG